MNPAHYRLPVFDPELGTDEGIVPGEEDHEVSLHHERTNLRLILDEHTNSPSDVFIERHRDHWLVILHPDSGDPIVIASLYKDHVRLEYGRGRLSSVFETTIPLE
jgi:hypothetical protein